MTTKKIIHNKHYFIDNLVKISEYLKLIEAAKALCVWKEKKKRYIANLSIGEMAIRRCRGGRIK